MWDSTLAFWQISPLLSESEEMWTFCRKVKYWSCGATDPGSRGEGGIDAVRPAEIWIIDT
jgi:hypothetical protein